jgi:hypothetical protein
MDRQRCHTIIDDLEDLFHHLCNFLHLTSLGEGLFGDFELQGEGKFWTEIFIGLGSRTWLGFIHESHSFGFLGS